MVNLPILLDHSYKHDSKEQIYYHIRKRMEQRNELVWSGISSFKFLDFNKNLKLGLGAVGKMYTVAALLIIMLELFGMEQQHRHILTLLHHHQTIMFCKCDNLTVKIGNIIFASSPFPFLSYPHVGCGLRDCCPHHTLTLTPIYRGACPFSNSGGSNYKRFR